MNSRDLLLEINTCHFQGTIVHWVRYVTWPSMAAVQIVNFQGTIVH